MGACMRLRIVGLVSDTSAVAVSLFSCSFIVSRDLVAVADFAAVLQVIGEFLVIDSKWRGRSFQRSPKSLPGKLIWGRN